MKKLFILLCSSVLTVGSVACSTGVKIEQALDIDNLQYNNNIEQIAFDEELLSDANEQITEAGYNNMPLICYDNFLNGNIDAEVREETININDIFINDNDEQIKYNQYALFDMNGDGIPELHVRSVADYYIFTYKDDKVVLWYVDVAYSYPLNNGAVLYMRPGGGPTHISYQYTLFNFYGEEIYQITFIKYDENYNEEEAMFLFDDVELSKEDWDLLTERYFSIESDLIEWITFGRY